MIERNWSKTVGAIAQHFPIKYRGSFEEYQYNGTITIEIILGIFYLYR